MSSGIFRSFFLLFLLAISVTQTAFAGWQICPRCHQPHIWVNDPVTPQSPSHQSQIRQQNGTAVRSAPTNASRQVAIGGRDADDGAGWDPSGGYKGNLLLRVKNGALHFRSRVSTGMAPLILNDQGCIDVSFEEGKRAYAHGVLGQAVIQKLKNSYKAWLKTNQNISSALRTRIEKFIDRDRKVDLWLERDIAQKVEQRAQYENGIGALTDFGKFSEKLLANDEALKQLLALNAYTMEERAINPNQSIPPPLPDSELDKAHTEAHAAYLSPDNYLTLLNQRFLPYGIIAGARLLDRSLSKADWHLNSRKLQDEAGFPKKAADGSFIIDEAYLEKAKDYIKRMAALAQKEITHIQTEEIAPLSALIAKPKENNLEYEAMRDCDAPEDLDKARLAGLEEWERARK